MNDTTHPGDLQATLNDPAVPNTDASVDVTPRRIGRHRILEKIGAGGMGVVYAAYDPELDRKIAIKLVRGGPGDGATVGRSRDRMKREAQAMARLNHPNVITVYDVGEHEGRLFIAMEFVDGSAVSEWLLRRPRPTTVEQQVRMRLFRARGAFEGGDLEGAAAIYAAGVTEAESLGFDPLLAEALQQLASTEEAFGRADEAEALYSRCYKLALASGHDDAAHRCAIALGFLTAFTHGRTDDAKTWIDTARGLAIRAKLPADDLATLDVNEAQVEMQRGNFDLALELARRGREQLDEIAEDDDPRLLESYQVQAMAHAHRHELGEARALFESAVALAAAHGAEHPEVARARVNLAVVLKMMDELEAATRTLEEALPVFERAYGDGHPHVATILYELGELARDRGQPTAAQGYFARALSLRIKVLGERHPETLDVIEAQAGMASDLDRHSEAVTALRGTLAIREAVQGPDHPELEPALMQLGTSLVADGQVEAGLASIRRAAAILEQAHGADHVSVAKPLTTLGWALVEGGRQAEAVAPLQRALRLRLADSSVTAAELADTQAALSRALWPGGDGSRARELARAAQASFRAAQSTLPQTQHEIDAWVATIEGTEPPR